MVDRELDRTPNQTSRRKRIVTAARRLATHSSESVHLRMVADHAGVATSSVYQYFSSKDELLLACFLEWLAEQETHGRTSMPRDAMPHHSLFDLVRNLTIALSETPRLATYAARAYFTDGCPTGANADRIRCSLSTMFADQIQVGIAAANRHALGEMVADVWAANMLALVQNRISLPNALVRLEMAVAIIERRGIATGRTVAPT